MGIFPKKTKIVSRAYSTKTLLQPKIDIGLHPVGRERKALGDACNFFAHLWLQGARKRTLCIDYGMGTMVFIEFFLYIFFFYYFIIIIFFSIIH